MPSVTASSAGTSATIRLDHIGPSGIEATIAVVFTSSTSSAAFTLQGTLDDPALVTSPSWFNLSSNSATFATSSPTTWTSSTHFDSMPLAIPVLTPLSAVRCNSTGLSSGGIKLTVLQAGSY